MILERMFFPLVVVFLLAAAVAAVVFTVDERELVIKFRFGEIVKSDYEPGLHFKAPPPFNSVRKFDKRIMTQNSPTELFLTVEKKNLLVDFFIKWRITDIDRYYRATGGQEIIAAQRLMQIIKDGIKVEFAKRTVQEVVSAERSELMDEMLVLAGQTAQELGIQLVDVRVKRIDLPDTISDSVFARMRRERERTARELRAEGAESAERIRAEADRERTVLLAEAYRDAELVRGDGDANSANIYANAYDKNSEFYAFYRSLESYRKSVGSGQDVLVLSPDSEFFRYLQNVQGAVPGN